jgi:SAM-dependent methyltransferase
MGVQQHQSDPRILDRRTLQKDHPYLAGILARGMSVLDVGCGTGAITKGIAEAVGPTGTVVGVDRDQALVERARPHCRLLPNLSFEEGDATTLSFERRFDAVTSARTLQWIADVAGAISCMTRATKYGGLIVVLDYNHSLNEWVPKPPPQFAAFYNAFLVWRRSNGWDNEIGNHLPELFQEAGLVDIQSSPQDEITKLGDHDFAEATALWTEVIDNIAPALQKSGFCGASLLDDARNVYGDWRKKALVKQTLSMTAVVAKVPDANFLRPPTRESRNHLSRGQY